LIYIHLQNSSFLPIKSVNKKNINKYTIINFSSRKKNLYTISSINEKPSITKANTNLAIIHIFILTPNIFKLLSKTKPNHHNEIQLTNTIHALLSTDDVYAYQFLIQRYHCRNKIIYLKTTINYTLKHKKLNNDFKKYIKNNK
jgi:UDP-glucose pyrophosphorylase